MVWVDIVGYAAAVAVLGSFCMTTIVPLRILAVVSNLLFGTYGVMAHLYPVFFLHAISVADQRGQACTAPVFCRRRCASGQWRAPSELPVADRFSDQAAGLDGRA